MNIKERRLELKLTQMSVAKACGVSLMTYSLWEREISTPKPENMAKLKEVLKIE